MQGLESGKQKLVSCLALVSWALLSSLAPPPSLSADPSGLWVSALTSAPADFPVPGVVKKCQRRDKRRKNES